MMLIDQKRKAIMEECKRRAREDGYEFDDQTLEYEVTNKDMIRLSPKIGISTLYDYWVQDLEIIKGDRVYEISPHNAYETVVNTRPPVSYYNDNNQDWMNVMIFYHVIGHIHFFQNNFMFQHTWDDNFEERALVDKRKIADLRSEKGRWLDYAVEFARGIDNLVDYAQVLNQVTRPKPAKKGKTDFYFDIFLQDIAKVSEADFDREVARYNRLCRTENSEDIGYLEATTFMPEVHIKHREFEEMYRRYKDGKLEDLVERPLDVMEFIMEHSPKLKNRKHAWMKDVLRIVRNTSLYFQPQIHTKICNEGWASYTHERLFMKDPRINGHEVEFAILDTNVTAVPRAGINPYAIGKRLMEYAHDCAEQGKLTHDFNKISDIQQRKRYNQKTGKGKEYLFDVVRNHSDFTLINQFVDQEFCDRYKLMVVRRRPHPQKQGYWQYYVHSRRAEDYKKMLIDSLYHPPKVTVDMRLSTDKKLKLVHHYEGKPLKRAWIGPVLRGVEHLYGAPVILDTAEPRTERDTLPMLVTQEQAEALRQNAKKVKYLMKDGKLTRQEP